ncbi:unknown [Alistipes sp. CAG:53]|nr:unknown [Alistipes sp. CAG:53]
MVRFSVCAIFISRMNSVIGKGNSSLTRRPIACSRGMNMRS